MFVCPSCVPAMSWRLVQLEPRLKRISDPVKSSGCLGWFLLNKYFSYLSSQQQESQQNSQINPFLYYLKLFPHYDWTYSSRITLTVPFFNYVPSNTIYMSKLVHFDLGRTLREMFPSIATKGRAPCDQVRRKKQKTEESDSLWSGCRVLGFVRVWKDKKRHKWSN